MIDCDICDLGEETIKKKRYSWVKGTGDKSAKIMFVIDVISQQDSSIGAPFTGNLGMLFKELVEKAGYKVGDTYVTALIKCHSKKLVQKHVEACGDYLYEEIMKIEPEVIVPLGTVATKYFLGQKKISNVRGYIFEPTEYQIGTQKLLPKVIPTYSINAIIGLPTNLFELQSDITKAFKVAYGKNYPEVPRTYLLTKQLSATYDLIKKHEYVAFDIETTGLDHYKDDIISCSFSWKAGQSICIPFDENIFKKIFALPIKWICHTKFDVKFMKCRYGIETKDFYFDTFGAIKLLNDNAGAGLKNLASLYTDVPYYNLDTKVGLQDVPIETVAEYNNFDADVTFRLFELFHDQIEIQGFHDLFYDTTMPVNRMLIEIEEEGITVDKDRLKETGLRKNLDMLKMKSQLDVIAPINWNSTKQVGNVFFMAYDKDNFPHSLGLKCPIMTPTGNFSTNEKVLNIIKNKHSAPKMLLELRHLNKGLGTYLTGVFKEDKFKPPKYIAKEQQHRWQLIQGQLEVLENIKNIKKYEPDLSSDLWKLLQDDGKLHNDNNIGGTVSGRLTSPLHTIPRDGGYRDLFIPGPGFVFVGMDYKQFELRIAAFLAGETELLEILDSPKCKEILTKLITGSDYTEEDWTHTKGVIYGNLYGMGPNTMSESLCIDIDHAIELKDSFYRNFKKVKYLIGLYKRNSLAKGYIEDMVGRRRRFLTKEYKLFDNDGDIVRQAINFPIQAGSAAIFWPKVLQVHNFLRQYKSKVIHTKHDAIYFKIADEEHFLIDKLKDMLENDTLIGRVLMDVKIGRNWGEC